jgi:hypothetical protein
MLDRERPKKIDISEAEKEQLFEKASKYIPKKLREEKVFKSDPDNYNKQLRTRIRLYLSRHADIGILQNLAGNAEKLFADLYNDLKANVNLPLPEMDVAEEPNQVPHTKKHPHEDLPPEQLEEKSRSEHKIKDKIERKKMPLFDEEV